MLSNLVSYPQTKPQTFYLALHAFLPAHRVCSALIPLISHLHKSGRPQIIHHFHSKSSQSILTYMHAYDVPKLPLHNDLRGCGNSSPHPLPLLFAPSCLVYSATPLPLSHPLPAEQIRGINPFGRKGKTDKRSEQNYNVEFLMRGLMRAR